MVDVYNRKVTNDGIAICIRSKVNSCNDCFAVVSCKLYESQKFGGFQIYREGGAVSGTIRATKTCQGIMTFKTKEEEQMDICDKVRNDELQDMENIRIRKLTPRECLRLMAFDDADVDKAIAAGISNSQLYKQAGNSIVVSVLENIFKEML